MTYRAKGRIISSNALASALEAADLGLRVFPLIAGKNRPDHKGWQEFATTDPLTIQQWFAEKPYMNYGIRTGLVNNLVVIDLDGPEARAWWESTGIPDSTAMVRSPRENGGEHHYFRIYDVEIGNSQGKIHPSVDVRGEGGFVAGPGCRRNEPGKVGAYVGSLANIPDAPPELLAILPERQSFTYEPGLYEGEEKVAEASESEENDLAHIRNGLLSLPKVWAPGAGWHDTVFRSCCWLWRMVRTPSYAITEAEAIDLMLTYTPTYPGWAEDEILKQWESAARTTEGQYADPPANELPPLLDFVEMVNSLPEFAPRSQRAFFELVGDGGAKPVKLIEECLLAHFDVQQTATILHGAKCGDQYRSGEYGLRKLYRDVESAAQRLAAEISPRETPSLAEVEPAKKLELAEIQRLEVPDRPEPIPLLDLKERESIRDSKWWGQRYLDWVQGVVPVYNAPYHRMNRWMILATILAPHAVIGYEGGKEMGLNLNCMVLGKTTTGKSESLDIAKSVIREVFDGDADPDIGGDPSPSALSAVLIERDGRSSLFNSDEADGQIAKMKQEKGPYVGLQQLLTQLYEGEVPKLLRTTNKDVSNKRARTFFTIHYMGTFDGIAEILDPEDWQSGFLMRFVWAIGEDAQESAEAIRPKILSAKTPAGFEVRAMQKQWAAELQGASAALGVVGSPGYMRIPDEVIDRHVAMVARMNQVIAERPEMGERLKPAVRRLANSVLKATCLVAGSDGRLDVTMADLLIAIEQAEEWLGNLLHMAVATDTSGFARNVDRVEDFLRSVGGETRMENVYRMFSSRGKANTDTLVTQLVAEGRSKREMHQDGSTTLKLIGGA